MRIALLVTAAVACLCVAPVLNLSRGQVAVPERARSLRAQSSGLLSGAEVRNTRYPNPAHGVTTVRTSNRATNAADQKRDREIAAATKQLRDAETSEDRAEARRRLSALLSKDYDARLDTHGDELDRLQKRLTEMRARLEKRRAAKQDMIELRLKVLEAEASDLGWPARSSGRQNVWSDWGDVPRSFPILQTAPSAPLDSYNRPPSSK